MENESTNSELETLDMLNRQLPDWRNAFRTDHGLIVETDSGEVFYKRID